MGPSSAREDLKQGEGAEEAPLGAVWGKSGGDGGACKAAGQSRVVFVQIVTCSHASTRVSLHIFAFNPPCHLQTSPERLPPCLERRCPRTAHHNEQLPRLPVPNSLEPKQGTAALKRASLPPVKTARVLMRCKTHVVNNAELRVQFRGMRTECDCVLQQARRHAGPQQVSKAGQVG